MLYHLEILLFLTCFTVRRESPTSKNMREIYGPAMGSCKCLFSLPLNRAWKDILSIE